MSAPARAWLTAVRASSSTRGVVVDALPSSRSDAAVAVVGVLAQAHVGDHEQLGQRLLDRARGQLHDALLVPRARALLVLLARARRTASPRRSRARRPRAPRSTRCGDRQALDARHRRDRLAGAARTSGLGHEQRQHELAGAQLGLAHEPAQAGASRAVCACASVGKAIASQVRASRARRKRRARAQSRAQPTRASAPNTTSARRGAPARCRSPGEAPLTAASSACRAALNGNTNEIAPIASYSPRDTEPRGTSARKASGSDSRKASSEAARTSRASAPIATPERAERERAERERDQPTGRRGYQSSADERADAGEHREGEHERAARGQQQPSRRAAPRARSELRGRRRASVCSSRSSATPPAASSTQTNISDTLTATTTANVFSGVRRPCMQRALDLDRLADRRQHVLGQAEVLRGEVGERVDPFQLRARRRRRAGAR